MIRFLTLILVIQCLLVSLNADDIPDDVGTFAHVLKISCFFDRTEMICDFFNDEPCVAVIERDKRGRTSNLDMIKTFCERPVDANGMPIAEEQRFRTKNYELFSNTYSPSRASNVHLDVFNNKTFFNEHFGRYPVIFMDFKPWNGRSYGTFMTDCMKIFSSAYENYKYLLKSPKLSAEEQKELETYYTKLSAASASEDDVKRCMACLCKMLHKHFNEKVIVLLDNYEYPVGQAFAESSESFLRVAPFFVSIMTDFLRCPDVARALITAGESFGGVLKVPKGVYKYHYSIYHTYVDYYQRVMDE